MIKKLLHIVLILQLSVCYTQFTRVTDHVVFDSYNQNMFGVNGFNLNTEIPIFNTAWNEGPVADSAIITTYFGDYGYRFSGFTNGSMGARFYSRNWDDGSIDVFYPVDIDVAYPAHGTYVRGDTVDILTDYTVDPTASITTRFPQSGNIGLEYDYDLNFGLNTEICFGGCINPVSFNQSFQDTITIFDVNAQRAKYICPDSLNTSWYCEQPLLPYSFSFPIGISGTLDLPNVQTVSTIGVDNCLYAEGEDVYATISLEVFKLLSNLPIPYASWLNALNSDTTCVRPEPPVRQFNLCFAYTVATAAFNMQVINKQEISFCPQIYTTFTFPKDVDYLVVNPDLGNSIVEGPNTNDSVTVEVGNTLRIVTGCDDTLSVGTLHDLTNVLSNKTYDSIAFDFTFQALSATIELRGFGAGENPDDSSNVDSRFWTFGPLVNTVFPLGSVPGITWYNNSWEMPGFDSVPGSSYGLVPMDFYVETEEETPVSCYGDSNAKMWVKVFNGNSPYELSWSNGSLDTLIGDSMIKGGFNAGNHTVNVTDELGCTTSHSFDVQQPDSLSLISVSNIVSCYGGNDGGVNIEVSGGVPPYSYLWSNGEVTEDVGNLDYGVHAVEVTDSRFCSLIDSFFVDQTDSMIIEKEITPISCVDNEDGAISIYVTGGNGGYSYLWSTGEVTDMIYDLPAGQYNLEVTDFKGCQKYDTLIINSSIADCIQPPNAFTPDGDGINDTWVLENIENYPKAEIMIFNHWGKLVYQSKDQPYTGWNGTTFNGKALPEATYYYVIDLHNGKPRYSGAITIVLP